jgi:hypothetical protein
MGVRWETLARSNMVSGLAEARRAIAVSVAVADAERYWALDF